jgi:hypothetical protein
MDGSSNNGAQPLAFIERVVRVFFVDQVFFLATLC